MGEDSPTAHGGVARTITVLGHGRAMRRPDEAEIVLGVDIVRPTAREARAAAAETMESVVRRLIEAGLDRQDIRTTDLSLAAELEYGPEGRPRRVGFRLANRVAIRVRRTDDVAAVLDGAVEAGATTVDAVTFRVGDDGDARREALAAAVVDARASAEAVVAAAKAQLGRVSSVREPLADGHAPMQRFAMMEAKAADTPVAPGMAEVRASLEVTWELAD